MTPKREREMPDPSPLADRLGDSGGVDDEFSDVTEEWRPPEGRPMPDPTPMPLPAREDSLEQGQGLLSRAKRFFSKK
ncbi:MAG: hypothetical protein JXX28_01405 [Deltaproteobacteria bacterium]|nr:hypothetical protein [Deltaproteobacteria bacterium]